MDNSEEDDEDEGEEWLGDWTATVAAPSAPSRAVTQRSTAGSLHRSTSEHTHTSVWTGHTVVKMLDQREGERRTTEQSVGLIRIRIKDLFTIISPTQTGIMQQHK